MTEHPPRIDGVILPDSPELRAAQRERFERADAALREYADSVVHPRQSSGPPPVGIIGDRPFRMPREHCDAVHSDECARERARRAEWSKRRQERRARRLSFEIPRPEWNSPTLPG